MNISKSKGLSFVSVFIILVIYNVIAFVLPFERSGIFWIGYGFSMAAILLAAGVGFYALGRTELRSKVYGMPLLSLAWIYLIVQIIIGVLEMALSFIPIQYGIVLNTILLGVFLIGLIAADIVKEEIQNIDEKIEQKVYFISSLRDDVEGLASKSTDEATKKVLKDLAEVIRYSDPMSSTQLAALENKIDNKVMELEDAADSSDFVTIKSLCDELQQLIADRNRKCKTLK